MDTTRAGLWDDGEGFRLVRGLALPIMGGVRTSCLASFSSSLLTFFLQWSNRFDGCFSANGCGFVRGCSGSLFSFYVFCVYL